MGRHTLPPRDTMERLSNVDWEDVIKRYKAWKLLGTTEEFPVLELSDAVSALSYVHKRKTVEIALLLGEKKSVLSSLLPYAFLGEQARRLADSARPSKDRLLAIDVLVIFQMDHEKQLRSAYNLLSARKHTQTRLYADSTEGV